MLENGFWLGTLALAGLATVFCFWMWFRNYVGPRLGFGGHKAQEQPEQSESPERKPTRMPDAMSPQDVEAESEGPGEDGGR
jgi:hypothetical protein